MVACGSAESESGRSVEDMVRVIEEGGGPARISAPEASVMMRKLPTGVESAGDHPCCGRRRHGGAWSSKERRPPAGDHHCADAVGASLGDEAVEEGSRLILGDGCTSVAPVLHQGCTVHGCCTSVAPGLHQYCTSVAPGLHQCCTRVAPVLHQCCTSVAPVLRRCCTSVAPVLHQCCTRVAPVSHQCCTRVAPSLHQCCTSVAPVLHQCCTSVAPVLHQCYTSVAPVLHQCCTSVAPMLHLCRTAHPCCWPCREGAGQTHRRVYCSRCEATGSSRKGDEPGQRRDYCPRRVAAARRAETPRMLGP
jgi:hypothetical protein